MYNDGEEDELGYGYDGGGGGSGSGSGGFADDYDNLDAGGDMYGGISLDEAQFADARVHPMLAMQAPRGAEYLYADDYAGKKMSLGDRFGWMIGSAYLAGGGFGCPVRPLRGWA